LSTHRDRVVIERYLVGTGVSKKSAHQYKKTNVKAIEKKTGPEGKNGEELILTRGRGECTG